jgi:hypothetical protein
MAGEENAHVPWIVLIWQEGDVGAVEYLIGRLAVREGERHRSRLRQDRLHLRTLQQGIAAPADEHLQAGPHEVGDDRQISVLAVETDHSHVLRQVPRLQGSLHHPKRSRQLAARVAVALAAEGASPVASLPSGA